MLATAARQLSFPEPQAPFPAPFALDLYALSIPARTFTGDFFVADGAAPAPWFALGDVAGKGLGAAVYMAMIQETLDAHLDRCRSVASNPAALAEELDVLLRSVLPPNRFASAVIASIASCGTLRVANAGHCPLMIARRDGSLDLVGSTGPVLGIVSGARWHNETAVLRPGDAVLAYSDGAIEAPNAEGEEYGVERLSRSFARHAARLRSAARIAAAVERDIRRFAGGFEDDLTLVVSRPA